MKSDEVYRNAAGGDGGSSIVATGSASRNSMALPQVSSSQKLTDLLAQLERDEAEWYASDDDVDGEVSQGVAQHVVGMVAQDGEYLSVNSAAQGDEHHGMDVGARNGEAAQVVAQHVVGMVAHDGEYLSVDSVAQGDVHHDMDVGAREDDLARRAGQESGHRDTDVQSERRETGAGERNVNRVDAPGGTGADTAETCGAPTRDGNWCGNSVYCSRIMHQEWRIDNGLYCYVPTLYACISHPQVLSRSCAQCTEVRAALRGKLMGTRSRPVQLPFSQWLGMLAMLGPA